MRPPKNGEFTVTHADGKISHRLRNQLHCLTGPVIIYPTGEEFYYIGKEKDNGK